MSKDVEREWICGGCYEFKEVSRSRGRCEKAIMIAGASVPMGKLRGPCTQAPALAPGGCYFCFTLCVFPAEDFITRFPEQQHRQRRWIIIGYTPAPIQLILDRDFIRREKRIVHSFSARRSEAFGCPNVMLTLRRFRMEHQALHSHPAAVQSHLDLRIHSYEVGSTLSAACLAIVSSLARRNVAMLNTTTKDYPIDPNTACHMRSECF